MAFVFNFRRFLAFRISTIRFQWVVENSILCQETKSPLYNNNLTLQTDFLDFWFLTPPQLYLRMALSG